MDGDDSLEVTRIRRRDWRRKYCTIGERNAPAHARATLSLRVAFQVGFGVDSLPMAWHTWTLLYSAMMV